jgi:hypothetical protein
MATSSSRPRGRTSSRRRAKPKRRENGAPSDAGTKLRARFDDLLGQGAGLWSDDEFERFRIWLGERRRRGD